MRRFVDINYELGFVPHHQLVGKVKEIRTKAKNTTFEELYPKFIQSGKNPKRNSFEHKFESILETNQIDFIPQSRAFGKCFDAILGDTIFEFDGWVHGIEGTGLLSHSSLPQRMRDGIRANYLCNTDFKLVALREPNELEEFLAMDFDTYANCIINQIIDEFGNPMQYTENELKISLKQFVNYPKFRYASAIGSRIIKHFNNAWLLVHGLDSPYMNENDFEIILHTLWVCIQNHQIYFNQDSREIYEQLEGCGLFRWRFVQPTIIKNFLQDFGTKYHNFLIPQFRYGENLFAIAGLPNTKAIINSNTITFDQNTRMAEFLGIELHNDTIPDCAIITAWNEQEFYDQYLVLPDDLPFVAFIVETETIRVSDNF